MNRYAIVHTHTLRERERETKHMSMNVYVCEWLRAYLITKAAN